MTSSFAGWIQKLRLLDLTRHSAEKIEISTVGVSGVAASRTCGMEKLAWLTAFINRGFILVDEPTGYPNDGLIVMATALHLFGCFTLND